eukprot:9526467-Lingulodinium_polyedra.AAC.1
MPETRRRNQGRPAGILTQVEETTKHFGFHSASVDPELEMMNDMRSAKHVGDIVMTGKDKLVDAYVSHVER